MEKFCLSCSNGFKEIQIPKFNIVQEEYCGTAYKVNTEPLKAVYLEYVDGAELKLVSENLDTFLDGGTSNCFIKAC